MNISFLFSNGSYTEAPECDFDEDGPVGYYLSQTVGDAAGLHYTLYEREKYENESVPMWLVAFSTSWYVSHIFCNTWPDLIQLLASLSPIALASIIDEEDILTARELLAPYIRERQRRIDELKSRLMAT